MDSKVNYAAVGGFVLLLITFLILGIIWLSSGFSVEKYTTYAVYMQEAVTGLSIDATVEYNGVNVGSVKSITINKHDPHLVNLQLYIETDTPITQGTTARLNTRGVTGITYIALKDDGSDLRPLKKLPSQEYPVIKTAPSFFMQLDTALQKLNDNVATVSNSLQSLLDKDNLRSIKETLNHMDQVTGMLAKNNQKLNIILDNTARATIGFPQLIQSSTDTMRVFQTQTLPTTNHLMTNLDIISENLVELTSQLRQNPSILIRGKAPQPYGPGEK
ncbi:MAG: MlaD family protein [Gammaproteobacteria bacterium]